MTIDWIAMSQVATTVVLALAIISNATTQINNSFRCHKNECIISGKTLSSQKFNSKEYWIVHLSVKFHSSWIDKREQKDKISVVK